MKSKSTSDLPKRDNNEDEKKPRRMKKKEKITNEELLLKFDFSKLDESITSMNSTSQSKIVGHLLDKNAVIELDEKFKGKFENELLGSKSDSQIRPKTEKIKSKPRSKSLSFWESNSSPRKTTESKTLESDKAEEKNNNSDPGSSDNIQPESMLKNSPNLNQYSG